MNGKSILDCISVEKADIAQMGVDAVVNAANDGLRQGGGVCGAIFEAAGPEDMRAACKAIGGCPTGEAVITPGFGLKAKHVIHAVGPVWRGGGCGEEELLRSCYMRSLDLALGAGCASVAFPLISSGIFGYPKRDAWRVALSACVAWLQEHNDASMMIAFCVTSDGSLQLAKEAMQQLEVLKTNEEGNSPLYESLTRYIPKLEKCQKRIDEQLGSSDRDSAHSSAVFDNDCYDAMDKVSKAVYEFMDAHPEYELNHYYVTLEKHGIEWDDESMSKADVSKMNGREVMALLVGAVRAEHFCECALTEVFGPESILKWLTRLRELDARIVERIAIKSASGYCLYQYAYEDKLFITPSSIRYERKPHIESDENMVRKWSFKTSSPEFVKLFEELSRSVIRIMRQGEEPMVKDIGTTTFTVTYDDKSRESRVFSLPGESFEECFSIVKRMVPGCEPMPDVLA